MRHPLDVFAIKPIAKLASLFTTFLLGRSPRRLESVLKPALEAKSNASLLPDLEPALKFVNDGRIPGAFVGTILIRSRADSVTFANAARELLPSNSHIYWTDASTYKPFSAAAVAYQLESDVWSQDGMVVPTALTIDVELAAIVKALDIAMKRVQETPPSSRATSVHVFSDERTNLERLVNGKPWSGNFLDSAVIRRSMKLKDLGAS
jgi:hypothetical protein